MTSSIRIKIALAAGVLACGFSIGSTNSAQAACCVAYDYTDAHNNRDQVISTLTQRINAMQLAIIEAMRLGTGQLSGNLKEGMGASSNVANVQDDRAVAGRVEQSRLAAIASAASGASSCNVITGATSAASLPAAQQTFQAATTADMVNWDTGLLPASSGQDIAMEARITRQCQYYATQDDVNSGLCGSVANSTLQNASVDVSKSLFYTTPNSTSQTYDQQHMDAAKTFLINAMDPRPQGASLPKEATQPGGRQKAADREASAARLSIALDASNDVAARRAPLAGSSLTSWVQAMAAQSGQTPSATGQASWYDFMDIRSKGWFFNANWATAADSQSYQQAIKDIAMMQAFQVYQNWELYKLTEKQNLMLASMLSIQVQASRATQASTQQ